ncbi:hypothetical protein ACF09Z_34660 [Streptomyces erythrochromogenes]|uniref:hypothetical protein n=1 Tax=Streptomyces erythrochromogenes TaxID=285574 RepID=UPI0036F53755
MLEADGPSYGGRMINISPARTASDIEIRPIGEDEISAWDRALLRGFLSPHEGDGTEVRHRQFVPGRWLAAARNLRRAGLSSVPTAATTWS